MSTITPGARIELEKAWGWEPATVTRVSGSRIYYRHDGDGRSEGYTHTRHEGSTWRRILKPLSLDAADLSVMSDLEISLVIQVLHAGLPAPLYGRNEWQFCADRKWRADLAWPEAGVLCEVEGGIWKRTRTGRSAGHAHPLRFESDCEKYNEAQLQDLIVLRVTPAMVADGRALDYIRRALKEATP